MKVAILVVLLLFVAAVHVFNQSQRSPYVVNDLGDDPDILPGDHVCETAPGNGICTLRAALGEANNLGDEDAISFSVTGTSHTGGTVLPDVLQPVVIYDARTPCDADLLAPLFIIDGDGGDILRIRSPGVVVRGLGFTTSGMGIAISVQSKGSGAVLKCNAVAVRRPAPTVKCTKSGAWFTFHLTWCTTGATSVHHEDKSFTCTRPCRFRRRSVADPSEACPSNP